MRRGLLSWSHEEIAPETLERRAGRLRLALRREGVGALVIHTDFTRPSASSRLVHFTPYWGRGMIIVTPDDAMTFATNLSNRVSGWMKSVSALEEIVCGPDIAAAIAARIPAGVRYVALVEMDHAPADLVAAISKARPDLELVDGTALFETALAGEGASDPIRIKLLEIAENGIDAGMAAASSQDANAVVAAADGACRLAGAEEVLIALAPDMKSDHSLRRVEGDVRLGSVFALQLSVAYKGYWLRRAKTVARVGEGDRIAELDAWFAAIAADPRLADDPAAVMGQAARDLPLGTLETWRIEAPQGGAVLKERAGSSLDTPSSTITGPSTLSVRVTHPEGTWIAARAIG